MTCAYASPPSACSQRLGLGVELSTVAGFGGLGLAILFLALMAPAPAKAQTCEPPASVIEAPPEEVRAALAETGKRVLTFLGYSGAEYEDAEAMLEQADRILGELEPSTTIINSGATTAGIGAVYELAKRRAFTTAGIVSTQAREHRAELSPCVDLLYYVPDQTWGGFLPDSEALSPTSAAIVLSSDVLIAIGGGEIGRDELVAANQAGKQVEYIAAEMNHQIARDKALKKGEPEPTDFRGAAADALQ